MKHKTYKIEFLIRIFPSYVYSCEEKLVIWYYIFIYFSILFVLMSKTKAIETRVKKKKNLKKENKGSDCRENCETNNRSLRIFVDYVE